MGALETRDKSTNVAAVLLGTGVPNDEGSDFATITPVAGISNGTWVEVKSWDKFSIGLYTTAAASFLVCASNLMPKPDDSTYDGHPLFYGQTGNINSKASYSTGAVAFSGAGEAILSWKSPIRWIKVKVTSNSGTVSASLVGV